MEISNMKTCLICLAIISMVAAAEVLLVDASAAPLDGGASNLSFNRRLLQVPANPWHRGCSRLTRCRGGSGGSRRPGGPGVQVSTEQSLRTRLKYNLTFQNKERSNHQIQRYTMGASSLRPWLICLAIISMVAVEEVLQVAAAATPDDGGISDLSYNRRLLQVPANPYSRGCSRFARCRSGRRGPPGVQN
ncbi:hypothetical protein GQ457_02G037870 [Hibiscus cannabinus]